MSERFPTEVTIGGFLPAGKLEEFATIVEAEGLGIEWEPSSCKSIIKSLKEAIRKGTNVSFSATELTGGLVEVLEDFCVNNNLSFVRRVDGKNDFNGEIVWWKPGMPDTASWEFTDKNAAKIMISREALEEKARSGLTLEDILKELHAVAPEPPALTTNPKRKPRTKSGKAFDPFDL